ncbi:MAG: hypothetical protein N2319_08015 [Candidatus Kapabacteria bacterium]|nr:hypothetical protein [Candidatus Kapabacteria bacterium]
MNESSFQSPSELLHLFLDGELEAGKETFLFSELASNEELRSEMRDLMLIRNKIKADSAPIAPPLETTASVFSSLGFNPTLLNPNAVAPFSGIVLSTLKKLWAPITTAIVASLITYFAINNNLDYLSTQCHLPMMVSYSIEPLTQDIAKNNPKEKIIYKYFDNSSYNNLANNNIYAKENQSQFDSKSNVNNTDLINFVKMDEIQNNSAFTLAEGKTKYNQINLGKNSLSLNQPKVLKNQDNEYSLQLRGINGISFPSVQVPYKQNTVFSNMSAAFYFARFGNFRIGFEFGNEPFGQVFNNNEGGTEWQYTQNAAIYWAGLDIMYIFDKEFLFNGGPKPFVQATLGGTELGPIGKFITGLQYFSKETGIGAMIGLEGTVLSYINQKVWYNTKKIGFTYGMSFHF